MEKRYKIYSLETSQALYGIVHNSQYDKSPEPQVLCEVVLSEWNSFGTEDEAMVTLENNKDRLRGKTLVVLPTIKLPYT